MPGPGGPPARGLEGASSLGPGSANRPEPVTIAAFGPRGVALARTFFASSDLPVLSRTSASRVKVSTVAGSPGRPAASRMPAARR